MSTDSQPGDPVTSPGSSSNNAKDAGLSDGASPVLPDAAHKKRKGGPGARVLIPIFNLFPFTVWLIGGRCELTVSEHHALLQLRPVIATCTPPRAGCHSWYQAKVPVAGPQILRYFSICNPQTDPCLTVVCE